MKVAYGLSLGVGVYHVVVGLGAVGLTVSSEVVTGSAGYSSFGLDLLLRAEGGGMGGFGVNDKDGCRAYTGGSGGGSGAAGGVAQVLPMTGFGDGGSGG